MNNVDSRILYVKNGYIYRAYSIGVLTREKIPENGEFTCEEPIQWFLTKDNIPVVYIEKKVYKLAKLIAQAFKPLDLVHYSIHYVDGNPQNCNFANLELISKNAEIVADQFKYQVSGKDGILGVYTAQQIEKIFGLNAKGLNAICDGKVPKRLIPSFEYEIARLGGTNEE